VFVSAGNHRVSGRKHSQAQEIQRNSMSSCGA
jgi:hypothetical protein